MLNRPDGRAATSEARIWLFQTGKDSEKPIVYYYAALIRTRIMAGDILTDFKEYLYYD